MPQVSVVIPAYNYGRYVMEAVESVLDQTFKDLELIVVDDGSTDDTRDRIRSFGNKVRYVYQPNQGLAATRNTGIRHARGEYVAFLDADDVWLPEKLSIQLPRLELSSEIGLVYADVLLWDDETKAALERPRIPHPSGRILDQLVLRNVIPSPTPVVRRSVFDRIGLFDETLKACEDWDMWIRIAMVCEVEYIDKPLAKYRYHLGNMSRDDARMMTSSLAVLDKVFADPDLPMEVKRLRRQAYGVIYADLGLDYFYIGKYELARSELLQAVKLQPRLLFYRQVARCMLACLAGPKFAKKIRSYRGKTFSHPPRPGAARPEESKWPHR